MPTDTSEQAMADVQEFVQAEIDQYMRAFGQRRGSPVDMRPDGARTPAGGRLPAAHEYNPQALGAALQGVFANLGEFLRAAYQPGQLEPERAERVRQAQSHLETAIPSSGGFLIPEEFRSDIMSASLERSIMRPGASVMPMSSLTALLPMIDDTSHESSVLGGFRGDWTEEGAALELTEPKFGRLRLEAKKLTGYTTVPNSLLADASMLAGWLQAALPRVVAWYEDLAFLTGSGAGEPLGVLNSPAAVTVSRGASNTISWNDITAMYSRMLPESLTSAVWVASQATIPALLQATINVRNEADDENVGGGPALLQFGGGTQAAPMRILGRPVFFTEKVPNLGSVGDLTFVDRGFYVVGDRQAAEVSFSEHYRFRHDETAVRVVERADGRLWIQAPITPANGGDSLSPVVKLGS